MEEVITLAQLNDRNRDGIAEGRLHGLYGKSHLRVAWGYRHEYSRPGIVGPVALIGPSAFTRKAVA